MWLSAPTWPNHPAIMRAAGLETRSYPYFDPATNEVQADAMLEALGQAGPGDVVLLHGCCHNPTGAELGLEHWDAIADLARGARLPAVRRLRLPGLRRRPGGGCRGRAPARGQGAADGRRGLLLEEFRALSRPGRLRLRARRLARAGGRHAGTAARRRARELLVAAGARCRGRRHHPGRRGPARRMAGRARRHARPHAGPARDARGAACARGATATASTSSRGTAACSR